MNLVALFAWMILVFFAGVIFGGYEARKHIKSEAKRL